MGTSWLLLLQGMGKIVGRVRGVLSLLPVLNLLRHFEKQFTGSSILSCKQSNSVFVFMLIEISLQI